MLVAWFWAGPVAAFAAEAPSTEAERYFHRGLAAVEMARTPADYTAAVQELEKAKQLAPHWPDVYYNLGLLYEQMDRYAEAAENLQKYLEMNTATKDGRNVRQKIYQLEYKIELNKQRNQDPKNLAGIWIQENDLKENTKSRRLEIRITGNTLQARVLPEDGWRASESGSAHMFIPDGPFVAAHWDGKNLEISDATGYTCTRSVLPDNCPRVHSFALQKISDTELSGEVKVKGFYYPSSGGQRWVDDYRYQKTWIRKSTP
jgi:tetratricopeptide (TPR) repeat protein